MAKNVTDDAAEIDRTKLPAKEDLFALRRSYQELSEDLDETRGSMGALLKNADEQKNIHRPAFKVVNKLLNMTPEKREAWLMQFDHMRETMALDEGSTQPMPFMRAAE